MQKVQIIYIYIHDIGFHWWSFDKHPSLLSDSNLLYARSILISSCVPRAIFCIMTSRRTWTNAIGYQNSKLLGPSQSNHLIYFPHESWGGFARQQHLLFPHPWTRPSLKTLSTQEIAIQADLPDALIHLQGLSYGLKLSTGKTPQIHKKKMDRIFRLQWNLSQWGSTWMSRVDLPSHNWLQTRTEIDITALGWMKILDRLPPHDTSFQMINYCTLCPLYIHALVHFEVLSHHIKNIHVSYFPALAPLTWMWFRCRSSRATVRFIFKASAKAWRALENNWSFWILPFLLGKSCSRIKSSYPFAKRLFFRSCSHQCRQTDHFNLEEWQQNKTCQNSFPMLMAFTVVPKICLAKWYQPYKEHWTTPLSNPPKPRYLGTKVSKSRVTQIEQSDTSVHRQCRGHDLHNPRMLAGKCLNQMGVSQALPTSYTKTWCVFRHPRECFKFGNAYIQGSSVACLHRIVTNFIAIKVQLFDAMILLERFSNGLPRAKGPNNEQPQCGVVIPMPHLGTLWANKIGL